MSPRPRIRKPSVLVCCLALFMALVLPAREARSQGAVISGLNVELNYNVIDIADANAGAITFLADNLGTQRDFVVAAASGEGDSIYYFSIEFSAPSTIAAQPSFFTLTAPTGVSVSQEIPADTQDFITDDFDVTQVEDQGVDILIPGAIYSSFSAMRSAFPAGDYTIGITFDDGSTGGGAISVEDPSTFQIDAPDAEFNFLGSIPSSVSITWSGAEPDDFRSYFFQVSGTTVSESTVTDASNAGNIGIVDVPGSPTFADGDIFFAFASVANEDAPTGADYSGFEYRAWKVISEGISDPSLGGDSEGDDGDNDAHSNDSPGCVLNPAAGFGLEWLFVALAACIPALRRS